MDIGLAGGRRRGQPARGRAQRERRLFQGLEGGAVRTDQADLAAGQRGAAAMDGEQGLQQAPGQALGGQEMQQLAARAQLRIEHMPQGRRSR
ncbi:hypothetical protein CBR71_11315 [Bordetella hinzii]|nr:hypothetical protein CBR70_11110 [Bordetella hinzii]QDJ46362.1 hypothetical protein CBR71_11315 [Bordetella hinzii]QDJ55287.1 hypothetical protein CBR72_10830 [Bordetella hinzii]